MVENNKMDVDKFFVACGLKNEGATVSPADLYQLYVEYSKEEEREPLPKNKFDKSIVSLGYQKRKVEKGVRHWWGLGEEPESLEKDSPPPSKKRDFASSLASSLPLKSEVEPHPDDMFLDIIEIIEKYLQEPTPEGLKDISSHIYYQHVYGRVSMLLDQKLEVWDVSIRHGISHDITLSLLSQTYTERGSWRDLVDSLVVLCGEEKPFDSIDSRKAKEIRKYFKNARKQLDFLTRSFLPLLKDACDCVYFEQEETKQEAGQENC